jgi:hypothetical protein
VPCLVKILAIEAAGNIPLGGTSLVLDRGLWASYLPPWAPSCMTSILARAARVLEGRLADLLDRLGEGDESAWGAFLATVNTYIAVLAQLTPGSRGELLTTRQMADRLNIAPKTLLKRKAKGQVRPALQLGERGRAAIRWRGNEVVR